MPLLEEQHRQRLHRRGARGRGRGEWQGVAANFDCLINNAQRALIYDLFKMQPL